MSLFKTYSAQNKRNRYLYGIIAIIVFFLGFYSRSGLVELPVFIELYLGDTLWALFVFLLFASLFSSFGSIKVAIIILMFSILLELSQLYHAVWIDTIRETLIGGLMLGFGFLWTDLICYIAGIIVGIVIDILIYRNSGF